jgi:condensin complex subunit 3
VASTLDCAGSSSNAATSAAVDRGVDLVRKQFGGPEVRSLMQIVLQRRNIITTIATANDGRNENETNEEDGISSNKDKDTGLSPSMALFLRVKCESMSDSISDIITDIPTLCNLLNSTIDKLIQFNNNEDYEDMDEDDAAAYEDDQNFVCLQLIHMARASELREEGSRRYFTSIMRRILSRLATPDDLVEACVKAMAAAHDKESQFLQTISEILVDVEDDDSFHSKVQDKRAIVIVRQMRIIAILSIVLESISGHMTSHYLDKIRLWENSSHC